MYKIQKRCAEDQTVHQLTTRMWQVAKKAKIYLPLKVSLIFSPPSLIVLNPISFLLHWWRMVVVVVGEKHGINFQHSTNYYIFLPRSIWVSMILLRQTENMKANVLPLSHFHTNAPGDLLSLTSSLCSVGFMIYMIRYEMDRKLYFWGLALCGESKLMKTTCWLSNRAFLIYRKTESSITQFHPPSIHVSPHAKLFFIYGNRKDLLVQKWFFAYCVYINKKGKCVTFSGKAFRCCFLKERSMDK